MNSLFLFTRVVFIQNSIEENQILWMRRKNKNDFDMSIHTIPVDREIIEKVRS